MLKLTIGWRHVPILKSRVTGTDITKAFELVQIHSAILLIEVVRSVIDLINI